MSANEREKSHSLSLFARQAVVCAAFALLLAIIIASFYLRDRQREWSLRCEQTKHRLDTAFELISREVDRVRADALFLADQQAVTEFASGDKNQLNALRTEYANFVNRKGTYDQIRLLNVDGREVIRVNYSPQRTTFVDTSELQDKSDRYYFRESLTLNSGDVFVSEFDLNLEYGKIERPLKPVIRFVAPVVNETGKVKAFLVLNYLGARLLHEVENSSLPGYTMLLRSDGHFLSSPDPADSWGWLLGHSKTFSTQFASEWSQIDELAECKLTPRGAFASKRISLGKKDAANSHERRTSDEVSDVKDSIVVVAYIPKDQVFEASTELLKRLLLLAGCVFVLVAVFARFWAQATLTRQLQAHEIVKSEEQLRDLSSRLLRIQEDERRAISREIHDEFGQQVTAINLDLKLAERNIESKRSQHLIRAISENEALLQSLHEFAKRVRPAVLDDLGLLDAVESHLSEFQQRTGIVVESVLPSNLSQVPNEIADNVYRLLQESLNNVVKHANATVVWVKMSLVHSDSPRFQISIRDNGSGFDLGSSCSGLGLQGIRERVDLLSGEMEIKSEIDRGTTIEIVLPLDGRSA